jgi:hypothetical protein
MGEKRASIFDGDDFDVSDLTTSPSARPAARARPEEVRRVAESQDFRSRESGQPGRQRRYRTGRNMQLNMKVRPETLERFNRLCDEQGWVQGEALEHALDALERELRSDPA